MRPIIRLTAMPEETHFAPLGVLGYCLTRTHFLDSVLKSVQWPLKTVIHPPESKLLDVLVSILAGCRAIRQVNTCLRPDLALARAWGRECFAEQATLARTLDRFTVERIGQLRQGSEVLFRNWHGCTPRNIGYHETLFSQLYPGNLSSTVGFVTH